MLSLIVTILFSLEVAYFAIQNQGGVNVRFVNYEVFGLPIYIVVVASILLGVLLSWFISALNSVSYFFNLRSKNGIIQKDRKEIAEMRNRIKVLEAENSNLQKKREKEEEDSAQYFNQNQDDITNRPSLFERIFPNSSRRYSKQI